MVYRFLIESLENLKEENIDDTEVRKQILMVQEEKITKYIKRGN